MKCGLKDVIGIAVEYYIHTEKFVRKSIREVPCMLSLSGNVHNAIAELGPLRCLVYK